MFEHFAVAGEDFFFGKCREERCGYDRCFRLGECTHHILEPQEVNTGFTSGRGVDCCKEGCRNVNHTNTAHISGCGKSGKIGDHTATNGYHYRAAVGLHLSQSTPDALSGIEIFVEVAGFNGD